jgi:hypothetical protein
MCGPALLNAILARWRVRYGTRETVVQDSLRGTASAKTAWPLVMSQEDITAHVGAIDVPTIVIGC